MSQSAMARAQAEEMLEQLVSVLKKQQRATKEAIQAARQAQVAVLGITIETRSEKGRSYDNGNEDENEG